MLVLSLILMCASAFASVQCTDKLFYKLEDAENHFEEFITKYEKQYANEEEQKLRFEIFKQNLEVINHKNSNPAETAIFGINQFADLTTEEFLERHTGFKADLASPVMFNKSITFTLKAPDSFDWREKNAVTRVKNQGCCGSCWAFSSTGAVEGAFAIKHGSLKEFSEQQLVDCSTKDNGCYGGYMRNGIQYLAKTGGQEGEADYPYAGRDQQCQFDRSKVKAVVKQMLPYNLTGEEDTKNYLVNHGPIAIAIDATDTEFYHSGIISECQVYNKLNHAVLLVGYGQENGTKFWIIKNSSGPQYGEHGYFRVRRAPNFNPCGFINDYAAGAVVA